MSTTKKHKVLALDSLVRPPPFSFDHELVQYENTSPTQALERIKDATIVLTSPTAITRAVIEAAPNLELIACNGTGTDHIDKEAARERGVTVCRVPAQNTDSVAEHAFALYFSLRRRVVEMHNIAMDGKIWAANELGSILGKPPRVNSEETMVIIGYGALGQRIEAIATVLGMNVLVAERKGASEVRQGRTDFQVALKKGTVFILVTPLDQSTRNMIGSDELASMNPTALIVNVGRGGVIDEAALAQACRDGKIGGAATDVFEHEPATRENCPLLDPSIPNLILSPHVAWFSSKTITGTLATVKANVEGYVAGRPQNIVVAGRGCPT